MGESCLECTARRQLLMTRWHGLLLVQQSQCCIIQKWFSDSPSVLILIIQRCSPRMHDWAHGSFLKLRRLDSMESKQREIGRQDTSGGNMNAGPNWANMQLTTTSISLLPRKQAEHKTKTSLVVDMSSHLMERVYVQRLIGQKECCMR